jgi:chemotaxis protein MotB
MYALWVYADGQNQFSIQQKAIYNKNIKLLHTEIDRLRKDSAFIDSSFHAYIIWCEQNQSKLKTNISQLNLDLQNNATTIKLSAKKIAELEALLYRKDSIMRATRDRLTAALIGFKDKGVNVHVEGGKVYISLDERLLFKSGQIDVNPAGKLALTEIAHVLNIDTTTNLTVEGHTDDIPFKSKTKPYKDNWDISVLRATSVVRLMQYQGKVSPKRFIASGRAEYYPLDAAKTPEARKKNRRIEIIVTPDLDEIARLLNN